MVEDDALPPPPRVSREPTSNNVAGEDFLFHLYRGSELLQDNRVHEAKQELEHALSLQPRDAKGQDLLAIVYFRLGLYPRAISIYESLIHLYPHAATPRINLALCYLKTGQAGSARFELERVIELNPHHARAWGYLGLAFQRLGDYERACHAFVAGGHETMARRLMEMVGPSPDAAPIGPPSPDLAVIGRAAGDAIDELEKKEFRTDSERAPRTPSGTWSAVEPGREPAPHERQTRRPSLPPSFLPSLAPSESLLPPVVRAPDLASILADTPIPPPPAAARFDASGAPTPHSRRPLETLAPPEPPEALARRLLLVFPRVQRAATHPSGLVLLQSARSIAVRFDTVRSLGFGSGYTTTMMNRRTRGKELEEPLGGAASPLFSIEGSGSLVIGPTVGTRLSLVALTSDPLFVRESALVAMEENVVYENGRLAAGGEGDSIAMVQLTSAASGPAPAPGGSAVLALPPSVWALEVPSDGRGVLVRAHSVLGWMGRVTPRAVSPSDAPAKMRGFISLSGEGTVLVDAR